MPVTTSCLVPRAPSHACRSGVPRKAECTD
jgi:hypothetical protein